MKRKAPVITQDELAAAIEQARQDFGMVAEALPRGALSIDGWCAKLGMRHTAMRDKMRAAVAAGTYERILVRGIDARGKPYSLPVYRKVPNAKLDRVR